MIFNRFAAFIFGDYVNFFFFLALQPKSDLGRLAVEVAYHTQLNKQTHTRWDSSERVISPSQRQLPTQHTTNTRDENHALSGIRTRDHRNRAATDPRLSPQGQRHNYSLIFIINNHLVLHTRALCVQHPLLTSTILPVIESIRFLFSLTD